MAEETGKEWKCVRCGHNEYDLGKLTSEHNVLL